jgi:hypothetical protein
MTIVDTHAAAAERAAHRATGADARARNLAALAALADCANNSQQADHIRGIVATTTAHLAADATVAARDSAAQWQAWALGLSDGLLVNAPTSADTP